MTETVKQQRIRRLYESFSLLCPDLRTASYQVWEDTPKDPPDICVEDKGLGIEFVDFIHGWGSSGSKAREQDVMIDRTISAAQQQFEAQYRIPLHVSVFWLVEARVTKSNVSPLAQALVKIVSNALPLVTNQTKKLEWNDFSETILANLLDSIHVTALPEIVGHWVSPQAGWVSFGVSAFESIVRKKEEKPPNYSKNFRVCWLVIVADGASISSIVHPDATVKLGCLSSKFDRVYFFNVPSNRIIMLTADEKLQ